VVFDKEKISGILQNLDRKLLLLETMDDFTIRKSAIDDILYNELHQLEELLGLDKEY